MQPRHPLIETCGQILHEELPNLFRLYLNPYVTQVCYCLSRYIQAIWSDRSGEYQTFLANSFDEALSGAIKLARYVTSKADQPGLVLDPVGRLGPFCSTQVAGGRVEFVPGLVVVSSEGELRRAEQSNEMFSFVVRVATRSPDLEAQTQALQPLLRHAPLLILCLDRAALAELRRAPSSLLDLRPDIVVFDESFVECDVPFGAFTARKELYDHWNRPGKTTFHSTTFQPNTVSCLHFMHCLEKSDPEFHAAIAPDLKRVLEDLLFRKERFRALYSPSLCNTIRMTGFDRLDVRASGHFVYAGDRQIFDCVSGVACSVRGHNPPSYSEELTSQGSLDECQAEVGARLRALTGLEHMLPAVSGAGAVENALKIALAAQYPRRYVLALKSGFGGKTLFALTGTWNAAYKERVDPLYPDVLYIDPFAPDVIPQLEAALQRQPVAVVQLELIQAVGGVRKVPDNVLRFLDAGRHRWGYLLLIDEVQTGMYRTGPFTLSGSLGLSPDLLVIGKGTSDMMFPFTMLLHSAAVRAKLDTLAPDLPDAIRQRYDYPFGYRTVLNVLRQAEGLQLAERVPESGKLFTRLLREELANCKAVRDVRVFGLLIGIELDARRWPRRWFHRQLYSFYLFNMLRHRRFPVLVGFCQYEPNVLKITPPLTTTPDEIRQVCSTIGEVLRKPFYRLLGSSLAGLFRRFAAAR
jgi:acetylornithine/succinyldiaminopimelate/putrescine aminotransferase